jgi:Do/DeqQ family serine protease
MRKFITTILIGFIGGLGGAYVYDRVNTDPKPYETELPVVQTSAPSGGIDFPAAISEDFVEASRSSTQSVVYVRNISERVYARSYLDFFLEPRSETRISSGSGVIFTSNGYIVTNNHVIQDADALEIVYNKKTYAAELVGVDPSTDLAVLKINDTGLPAIALGNSQDLQVGEWVIAVGNPFNLTSTVTAGIVSAKGRDINILRSKFPIESFIQTDAAINPGNSGGALVNKEGELIGINTAILSQTGSYAGYGFAVPIDIVKKVVNDIIEYGEVQKAFFGGEVADFNSEMAERLDIDVDPEKEFQGVLLGYVKEDGAAARGGLQEGDIILKIDEGRVNSRAEFDEELSYHSPGDNIIITYERDGKQQTTTITLTNREGTTSILKRDIFSSNILGADFEIVPKVERDLFELEYGVKVFNIKNGLMKDIGVSEEFIVTDINNYPIKNPDQLVEILTNIRGRVIMNGINKQGRRGYYSFNLR